MARWHKRLPTLPHAPTLSTRVLPLSVCVYLSRHTYVHTRTHWIEPKWHNARSEQCQLHTELPSGGFTCLCVHVCVRVCGAWVWALSCATLCNIFFVICFLCVCLFFGVTRQRRLVFVLVACHTHTHVAVCMCVGFVAKCVAVSLCVCVCSRKCYIVFGTQGDTATLSLTPTLRLTLKSTLTLTHSCVSISWKKVYGVATPGWLTGVVLLPLLL